MEKNYYFLNPKTKMKNLFKSVSSGNPAKFVWQQAVPKSAAAEWQESKEASKEANEAESQAVDAMMNLAQKKYEQGAEYADAVGASISEEADKLNTAIQEKVDSAKASMWSFAEKIYGKYKAGTEAVKTAYDSAANKVDEVATAGLNAAKNAYNYSIESIKNTAKVVAGAALVAGKKVLVDAPKYVCNEVSEGVEAGYDSAKEFGGDVVDGVADAAQTVGDFGRGVGDMAKNATARGRDIRLARNEVKTKSVDSTEEVALANENISSLPDNMKNFGNNPGEMIKNIPYKVRKAFVLENNIIDNYKGSGPQNKILFNYLEKNK